MVDIISLKDFPENIGTNKYLANGGNVKCQDSICGLTFDIRRRIRREFGLADAGILVDDEQRNRTQPQRRRSDRRDAAGSRIGDSLRRLSTVATVLRRRLLHPLYADRHSGKSHHGDRIVSHQKGP